MKSLFLVTLWTVLCLGMVNASTYYVDKDANGANDGSSWKNAHTTIQSAFSSHNLEPGDVVEVAGSTYLETVTTGADDCGSPSAQLVLRARIGDTVLIDGELKRSSAINFSASSYLTIDGFSTDNHTGPSIYCKGTGTGNVIRNCRINIDLEAALVPGPARNGMSLIDQDQITVENNYVTSDDLTTCGAQTDGITMGNCTNVIVRHNVSIIRNGFHVDVATDPHNDCYQLFFCKNVQIYNNAAIQFNAGSRKQGIFLEASNTDGPNVDYGEWIVYNNLIVGSWGSTGLNLQQRDDTVVSRVYNNTIVHTGTLGGVPATVEGASVHFYNNIVLSFRDNVCVNFAFGSAQVDNNCYFNGGGSVVSSSEGGFASWDKWRSQNDGAYDQHGLFADPSLDIDYKPDSITDPIIDRGIDLSSLFTTDLENKAREGGAWDIGAFEFQKSGAASRPTAPTGLRLR